MTDTTQSDTQSDIYLTQKEQDFLADIKQRIMRSELTITHRFQTLIDDNENWYIPDTYA